MKTNPTNLQRLSCLCLALAGALLFMLSSLSSPAVADDTDGGSGQGTGAGGDGCTQSGWRLVTDADDIVWQDSGQGRDCSNTAYINRNDWNRREFTDVGGNNHICDTRGGNYQTNCNGTWEYANAPLYTALGNINAGACYRRTDVHGIWYAQDIGDPGHLRSWSNVGDVPDGDHRSVNALKDAIDDSWDRTRRELIDSGSRGSDAWWDVRVREWKGAADYDFQVQVYGRDAVRDDAKRALMSTIRDVTGGNNPVIFCWFGTADKSGLTCQQVLGSSFVWGDWLHPAGVTQDSLYSDNCVRRCSLSQGQYPTALPHAGEWIPSSSSSRSPRPASNADDAVAEYCYPPSTSSWHQGAYGSEIPGMGRVDLGTTGSVSMTGAQPYAYTTTVEDGNGAYSPISKTGNALGQGQLTASSAVKKTAFGAFVDKYCPSQAACSTTKDGADPTEYNKFVADYNAAVAALPGESHATLELTNAQKAEVGRGRVMNVVERTTYSSAQARRSLDRFYTRLITRGISYTLTGQIRGNGTSTTPWTYDPIAHPTWNAERVPADMAGVYRPDFSVAHLDKPSTATDFAVYGSTPKVSGLWQNAVTHCNNQEFAPLNPSGTATNPNETGVIDTGDTSQYYSASAVYKVSDSKYRVDDNVDLTQARWGSLAGPNSPSTKPAFFDRLCYYPGTARNPVDNSVATTTVSGQFTYPRDGQKYIIEQSKANGTNSPYFVPDFRGEDRQSSTTVVTGYEADRSTLITPQAWTVTYQETYVASQTLVPATDSYYAGYFNEYFTCSIPRGRIACQAPNGTMCDHADSLRTNVRWSNNTGKPADQTQACQGKRFVQDTYTAGAGAYYINVLATRDRADAYTSDAAASTAYNTCVTNNRTAGAGKTTNCAKNSIVAVWGPTGRVQVGSCPQADTTTVRYTNCAPVTRTDTVTTNYNVVDYRNEEPSQLIVTRDPLSTPKASWATFEGLTNSGSSARLFSETDGDVRTPRSEGVNQSQFATSPAFASTTVAVTSGAYKRLRTKGVWPSDSALPQVLTMAWYFTPNVRSTFAQSNVGFGQTGGRMTYTKGDYTTPVRGRVEAVARSLSTDDGMSLAQHQNQVWANTGTNIEDNLNVPLYYGANRNAGAPNQWLKDPTAVNAHYYSVRFVRAVGE